MCTGKLYKAICYLAGPIEFDSNSGVSYRSKFIQESENLGLKIRYLDPTNKLQGLTREVGAEKMAIAQYKKEEKWEDLTKFMKKIVRSDLRQVDLSDFVVVFIDPSIHMCGTYHELIISDLQKKPVLTITAGGKDKTPSWLFGIIDHKFMFSSSTECLEFLVKLDKGELELNDRWVLFRRELDSFKILD